MKYDISKAISYIVFDGKTYMDLAGEKYSFVGTPTFETGFGSLITTNCYLVKDTQPNTILKASEEWTIAFWNYKPSNISWSSYVPVLGMDGGQVFYAIQTSDCGDGRLGIRIGGNGYHISCPYAMDRWNMVAFVNHAGNISIFLNGTKMSTTYSRDFYLNNLWIGAWPFGTIGCGYIQNFLIYRDALYTENFTAPDNPSASFFGSAYAFGSFHDTNDIIYGYRKEDS